MNSPKSAIFDMALGRHQAGRYLEAETLYRQVLAMEPDNYNALHYLGVLLHQSEQHDEALKVLLRAVTLHNNDPFVYNNLGAVFKKLNRLPDAEAAFRAALEIDPNFAGAFGNLGGVLRELGRQEEAEVAYRKALTVEPEMAGLWYDLGNLLCEQGRFFDAETAYRQSLASKPDRAEVYNSLGFILKEFGRLDESIQVYRQAIELRSDFVEAFCNLGIVLMELECLGDAETAFRKALSLKPDYAAAYGNLGNLLRVQGRTKEAEAACRDALAIDPDFAGAYCNLGNVFFECGRLEEAEEAYRHALAVAPDFAAAYCNLGNVFLELGRLDEAEAAYLDALNIDPLFFDAYCNISNLYRERGRLAEAEEACHEALLLKPDCAEALNNLSAVLLALGRLEEAENACRRALGIKPDFSEAHCSLGNVLCALEQMDEAVNAYRRSLICKPDYAEAYSNLGNVLIELGRYEEAKDAFLQALALKPLLHGCRIKLAMLPLPLVVASKEEAGMVPVAFSLSLDELEAAVERYGPAQLGKDVGALQPFNLAYRPGDQTELLSRYGGIICKARAAWFEHSSSAELPLVNSPRVRVRLLIVTGQIRRHSVWDVMLHGLLRHIDRSRFEVIVYHTTAKTDDETLRARSLVDRFVQGPADWLMHMRQDSPDIIFYPEIGMDNDTLKLAALRLAPLQAASWGHPITTGLSTIDLFFSGDLLERKDADSDYCERLVRLPGTGVCSVLMPFQARKPDPSKVDISRKSSITQFLVCQQALKFDPVFDDVYPRIAQQSGPCCFWFVRDRKFAWASKIIEDRIIKSFQCAGFEPEEYVRFVEWFPGEEFWGLMDMMDIYLDPPAFSGYTTAWQALHRGLPVVTCEGRFMRQRLAAGLLRKVGVTDTIATSVDEYVSIATTLASSPEMRESLRIRLCEAAQQADEDITVIRAFESALLKTIM